MRFSWAEVTFVEVERAAADRRGGSYRQVQPDPHARRLRARSPRALEATRVQFTLLTVPATLSDRLIESARRPLLDAAQEPARAAAPALDPRAGRGPRTARHGRRGVDCRVACPAACASSRSLALSLLAALALGACGDSHTRVTTGTYAGESGAAAPYLDVGPLVYQVQQSRELNPYDTEDASYLEGLTPEQRQLQPGQEWFGVFLQVFNHTGHSLPAASELTVTDTQGNTYTPVVAGSDESVHLSRRARPALGPAADARLGRRLRSDPGRAPALQDPGRLARQPAAEDQDRRPDELVADGLRRARRLVRAGLEAGFQHLPGHRRGRFAAGAVFDEHHPDDDPRPRCRRERSEPRVGVARLLRSRSRILPRRRSAPAFFVRGGFRSPGGALRSSVPPFPSCPRRARPGSPPRCPCRSCTTAIIRRRTVPATAALIARRRGRRARGRIERRPRRPPAVGDRGGDGRHLQRRREHLPLADRCRADGQFALDRRGGRQRALRRPRNAGVVVEPEAVRPSRPGAGRPA